mgnify:CR=1 FL=1
MGGEVSCSDVDYGSLVVWSFNRLPKYLWECWKQGLEERGITWQKLLGNLELRTAGITEWGLYGRLSWGELAERIRYTIEVYSEGRGK